jgi:ferritin
MLSTNLLDKLNAQITLEFFSSNLYLQMSSWCSFKGYTGCAAFLFNHYGEERMHMEKMYGYVHETGSLAVIDALAKPASEYPGLLDMFTKILEHEKLVTRSIYAIVDAALQEKDWATFNFLQWYVKEQMEEEALFTSVLDKVKIFATDDRNIFLLDKEIGKLARTA